MSENITAVVVTYNRKTLLCHCVNALLKQSVPPDRILVVDNASNDGTSNFFVGQGKLVNDRIDYLRLPHNTGGAGGFHAAIKYLMTKDCNWIWLMDDDAEPDQDALNALVALDKDSNAIYGSCTVSNSGLHDMLCWPVEIISATNSNKMVYRHDKLCNIQRVSNIPFLGFFFHRSLVERIGLPNKGFFISGDDAEFCARASRAQIPIYLVKASTIYHPLPQRRKVRVIHRNVNILNLPPWKRYYDVRNRLLIARKYYPLRLWTEVVPGTLLRWIVTLLTETGRVKQSKAYLYALLDGLLGREGIRWKPGE